MISQTILYLHFPTKAIFNNSNFFYPKTYHPQVDMLCPKSPLLSFHTHSQTKEKKTFLILLMF